MHTANHYYGHAHVFADYVDIPFPPMIWGYLQHGWNLHDGFAVGTGFLPGPTRLVWSDAVLRRGWGMGQRNYAVIGSAWAYLLELVEQGRTGDNLESWTPPKERKGTIFYPFHGWEAQPIIGDHHRMLDQLREVEGDEDITVCLYWTEHRIPEVRRAYEERGCRVITHGMRGFAFRGTETRFLWKQYAELMSHRRVVSNRMSSAVLYGASVGCEVGVYGDPMLLSGEHSVYGGIERQKRNWPEFHQEIVPRKHADEVAAEELGLRHVRTPAEIMDLFRWTRPAWQLAEKGTS